MTTDKENAAVVRRASSAPNPSSTAAKTFGSGGGTAGAGLFNAAATSSTARPSLGRDTGPTTLRLGQPNAIPVLRFADARMGGSRTLPLKLSNDTPLTQSIRFDKIPREHGFLVDPDRLSLPPGAHEIVRVSWCPLRPSKTVYCGTMHVLLDDGGGSGGGGSGGGGSRNGGGAVPPPGGCVKVVREVKVVKAVKEVNVVRKVVKKLVKDMVKQVELLVEPRRIGLARHQTQISTLVCCFLS